jgi:hypothetical protein
MNLPILAACFLLIFCPPHRHYRTHAHTHAAPVTQYDRGGEDDDAGSEDNAKPESPKKAGSCSSIEQAFHYASSNSSRDDFVRSYPEDQQRRVLICLEKSGVTK